MVMNTSRHAIRQDRALTPALGTAVLAPCTPTMAATKPNARTSQVAFAGVPAYVAQQESDPPRGGSSA